MKYLFFQYFIKIVKVFEMLIMFASSFKKYLCNNEFLSCINATFVVPYNAARCVNATLIFLEFQPP